MSSLEPKQVVGVGVFVLRHGEVLLGRRRTAVGESFEECAVREVKEETGLDVAGVDLVTVTNYVVTEPNPMQLIAVLVRANLVDPDQAPANLEPEKCDGWDWYPWNELPTPLFPPLETAVRRGVDPFPSLPGESAQLLPFVFKGCLRWFSFGGGMKTIMAREPHETFSFSRRFFWKKMGGDEDDEIEEILGGGEGAKSEGGVTLRYSLSARFPQPPPLKRKASSMFGISQLRSALGKARTHFSPGKGTKVSGALFGHRRGHVQLAFQEDSTGSPFFLVEMATPTAALVKEMASGLVRIALECEKKVERKGVKLLDEPLWRAYCNGKKCGYAARRECGPDEWKVLNLVGPISMGAGVLPAVGVPGVGAGEMMYMKAKFERVVCGKDSEAFYMMNPDGHGGPELSIYLLRA
ncbi:hypothetical protein M569_00633 [Genlisea aurea]|uniref:Nudix hydrolase domain-containing protein n=1 Tax=Genlisea aurea TaxID=192259 RepID=S8EN01_9LAMI|nr:hypothetical protein M569_00633 [Genlisea aurea]